MAVIREISAGGVVYRTVGSGQLLLIQDRYGRWTLPKGKVEPGETVEEAALREIREETGIQGRILDKIGETNYSYQDYRGIVDKTVHYYLVEAVDGQPKPQMTEVRDVRWFSVNDGLARFGYDNTLPIVNRAIAMMP
ncbi:MAG: NUDIX hydrolase [Bacillota bacterium]